jgi:hypothetical protein
VRSVPDPDHLGCLKEGNSAAVVPWTASTSCRHPLSCYIMKTRPVYISLHEDVEGNLLAHEWMHEQHEALGRASPWLTGEMAASISGAGSIGV